MFTIDVDAVGIYECMLVSPAENVVSKLVAYSQNDARWAQEIYASSLTFSKAGCLVSCVSMIVNTTYQKVILPPEVASNLKAAGAFVGDMLSRPSRITNAYPKLSWDGVVHYRTVPANMEFILKELNTYGYVIAELQWNPNGGSIITGNQHFVIITELTQDGDAVIIDPWDGETKTLLTSRYVLPNWTVARTITGLRLIHPK